MLVKNPMEIIFYEDVEEKERNPSYCKKTYEETEWCDRNTIHP